MSQGRPFRFGIRIAQAQSRAAWADSARRAEDLGYATLLMVDHLGDQLGPIAGLMAAADATSSLRLGTFVLANDYRHPAVLAKEAATLDLLSDGRLELGIGAGWVEEEYRQAGVPFDPPATRVERLGESVQILKGLFADGPFTFRGKHYTIEHYAGFPKPVQRPHPPLMIAAAGRRALGLAAREADIVGLIVATAGSRLDLADGPAERTARRIALLRAAAGARFDALELNTIVFNAVIAEDRAAAAARLAAEWQIPPERLLDTTHVLVGSVEQIVEQIHGWRERFGISYLVLPAEALDSFAPVVTRLAGR